jgi:hypothetical protein
VEGDRDEDRDNPGRCRVDGAGKVQTAILIVAPC